MVYRFMCIYFFIFSSIFILSPDFAVAYVDPGIVGSLFQIIYFIIFGLLAALFFKPIESLKKIFKKVKEIFKGKTGA